MSPLTEVLGLLCILLIWGVIALAALGRVIYHQIGGRR